MQYTPASQSTDEVVLDLKSFIDKEVRVWISIFIMDHLSWIWNSTVEREWGSQLALRDLWLELMYVDDIELQLQDCDNSPGILLKNSGSVA